MDFPFTITEDPQKLAERVRELRPPRAIRRAQAKRMPGWAKKLKEGEAAAPPAPDLNPMTCAACGHPMGLHPQPDFYPCPLVVIDGKGVTVL